MEDVLPAGPDRRQVVLHLTQEYNKALLFIAKDQDGPSKRDVIYLLERARRSLSIVRIFKEKTDPRKIQNDVEVAIAYLSSAVRFVRGMA